MSKIKTEDRQTGDGELDTEERQALADAATLARMEKDGKIDLSLPDEFLLEVVANQLLENLANYHTALRAAKAGRQAGEHKRAEEMWKQTQVFRLTVAFIEAEFPKAKALADELAKARARQTRDNRARLMETEV